MVCTDMENREANVNWLWQPFMSYGNLTGIFGEYAFDASQLMLFIAAGLTKGRRPFFIGREETPRDGSVHPENVCYLAPEDMIADTCGFLFDKAGGDRKRCIYFPEARNEVRLNAGLLTDVIINYGIRLFVVDTFELFRPDELLLRDRKGMHKAITDIRSVAHETGTAIVMISDVTEPLYGRETFLRYIRGFFPDVDNLLWIRADRTGRDSYILKGLKSNGHRTGTQARIDLEKGTIRTGWDYKTQWWQDIRMFAKDIRRR